MQSRAQSGGDEGRVRGGLNPHHWPLIEFENNQNISLIFSRIWENVVFLQPNYRKQQTVKYQMKKTLLILAAMLCCIMLNAQQPTGDGSQANPYQIATADNLVWFADYVNSGNAY